jgi:phage terminase large subunit
MPATATKRTRVLDDVLSFAQVGLGLELYDWQLECDIAIDKGAQYDRIKVALVAPNGSGKTQRIVAVSALRWLNRFPRGRVIITSADAKQLDAQLMPAITEHKHKFPGWEFIQRMVRHPAGGFILAFTTDESSRAEGHHATKDSPLLIIVDEAKSVEPEIFQAFDRCSYNVLLYISSPGIKLGRFYEAFTTHREQFLLCAQVGLTDCPHISKARIQDVIDTYGQDSQFTRSTLYGQFMDQDIDSPMVVDFQALQEVLYNPPGALISRHEYAAFCDFAAGRDENVLAIRSGNKLLELISWREKNTMGAVGRFIMEFRRHSLRAEQIWGDNGGMGHVMIDALQDAGWAINRFDFGAAASRSDIFISRGAEIWANIGKRIEKHEVVLINDPTLVSQLTTRQYSYDAKGRMRLEDKESMAARGLKSPDRADAVCGAFAHGQRSFAAFAREKDPFEQLEKYYDGLPKDDMESDDGATKIQRELGGFAGY